MDKSSNFAARCINLITLFVFFNGMVTCRLYDDCDTDVPNTFDYIIVGGGTAGSVIANRLSEDASKTVLLLEAGKMDRDIPESPLISTPALWFNTIGSDLMWKYKTERQKHALFGYPDHSIGVDMGRVLGGSSSVNGMIYNRGFKSDYDSWAESGALGWGYEDIMPFFLRVEGNKNHKNNAEDTCGMLSVTDVKRTESMDLVYQAAKEVGVPECDSRDPNPLGVFYSRTSIKSGTRHSSSDAYLWPYINRPNLHIVTDAVVVKVMIDPKSFEAEGVVYLQGNVETFAEAKIEVIVSAGPYGSPKLLMMSGIGPTNHLQDVGITPLVDLPVGDNLQQHMILIMPIVVDMPTLSKKNFSDVKSLEDYIFKRKGLLAAEFGHCDLFVYINSSNLVTKKDVPISSLNWLEGQVGPVFPSDNQPEGGDVNEESTGFDLSSVSSDKGYLTVFIMSSKPKSKGYVRLRSRHYSYLPVIDPNFLSSNFDVKVFLESIRYIQRMLKTSSLRSIGATLPPHSSACGLHPYDSDTYWECFIRTFALPSYHGVGTCPMGEGDKTVLDSRLRVKGVRRLRVADASVMPSTPSSNTMAPVYMIAEKAAHMIKEDLHTL